MIRSLYIDTYPKFTCVRRIIHSVDELRGIIKDNLQSLKSLLENNEACIKEFSETGSCTGKVQTSIITDDHGTAHAPTRLGIKYIMSGSGHRLFTYPYDITASNITIIIEDCNVIRRWVSDQSDVYNDIKDIAPEDIFNKKLIRPFVAEMKWSAVEYGYICATKPAVGLMCESCGYMVNKGGIKSHIGSMKCAQGAADKDVREKNWAVVKETTRMLAIKKAGVEFALRPTGYSMWVPPWVDEAIGKYQQITKQLPKGSQFAGLDLAEFLMKAKPDA